MAGIPINFQSFSNVLANYNFVDIASGTGYINFYAGSTVDLKLQSNFTFYSDTILESGTSASNIWALLFDHDYDMILNRPLDVKGLGIVNVPISVYNTSAVVSTYAYATITLRKVSGGVESDIVTNDSRQCQNPPSSGVPTMYFMTSTDLNVPLTHFKIGDTLRLTIQLYVGSSAGATSWTYGYAHDPMNRTTGWDTTGAVPSKLSFQCPVRLNL